MRKGVLLLVVLLAVASLMGAYAYSSAVVSSSTLGAIVETDQAFLAIIENPDFDEFAAIEGGKMVIDFTAGNTSGFQPGSSYTFNDLFYIKNNLDATIKVGMRFSSCYSGDPWIPGLWRVEGPDAMDHMPAGDSSYPNAFMRGQSAGSEFSSGYYEGRWEVLDPGEQIPIDWVFSVEGPLGLTRTQQLQIFAERVADPPPDPS